MADELQTNGATDEVSLKPTIVLIHGLWMSPTCWEDWIAHFTKKGYNTIAPGWPGLDDRTVEDIRAHPEALKGLTIGAVIEHYTKIIKALPSPPIIMGHSFGGLFTQILLSKGLGVAGVGLCPAQPAGVVTLKLTTVKASFGVLANPLNYNKAVKITESQFHYNFGNHLNKADSKALWQKYSIPAAGHILFQGVLGLISTKSEGTVAFGKKDRAPLLLIAGTNDHVIPKAVVEAVKDNYVGPAIVDLKVFEGRTHGIVNQAGWEEVADSALNWVKEKIKV